MRLIDQDTVGKVADATGEIAKTTNTALELTGKFGNFFKQPIQIAAAMLGNELLFLKNKRALTLVAKWNAEMEARGLSAPTRQIPVNFSIPLLTAGVLEETDELQERWARLLVNAGDASTPMELRTAYIEILKGMSAFDVRNLAALAELSLKFIDKGYAQAIPTDSLPGGAQNHGEPGGMPAPISDELGISLNNLTRLGCIIPASGWGGISLFHMVTVTHLGMALYKACS